MSTPPSHWLFVLCLIGVDYFSTLAYQTSITFKTAGLLGPPATIVVVVMTLCGALPVYWHIAGRSPDGHSSIALLQRFLRGWVGKTLVLILLGFATTDFVVTKTLSAASAAEHIIHNPNLQWQRNLTGVVTWVQDGIVRMAGANIDEVFTKKMLVTLTLGAMSFAFWALIHKGFRQKATRWAVVVVAAYLALNAIVVGSGLYYLSHQPDVWERWWTHVLNGDWHTTHRPFIGVSGWTLALTSMLLFPKLALGLSGLEMTIVAMPAIRANDRHDTRGRVRDTRKVMCVAALIMSACLLGSIVVTTLLIPPDQFAPGGSAAERALSYLAHGGQLTTGQTAAVVCPWFGESFGTLYDVVTIVILCLAGTSVITGLTTLLPQFLLKFGMQFQWVHRWGVLFGAFALMNLGVTLA
ncbi:MAG TPA: hypothetical protein VHV77_00855, partial [Pirellulales bacterium]|nr:hypothetical protein [Pirellulales bacterium]